MTNDALDTAIDEVAREMTSGEPHDAGLFRRGVLARIEGSQTSHRPRGLWILAPMGAVAAIAVAVALLRPAAPTPAGGPARPVDPRQPSSAAATQARTTPEASPGAGSPNVDGQRPGSRAIAATRVAVIRQPEAASAAPPPDGLAPPAALVVDSIAVEAIGVVRLPAAEPIQVERLETIAPIDVTPLGRDELPRRYQ